MVSLLADVVICAVLLGTGYYLFFSSASSSSTAVSGGKKRKKAKGKKAAGVGSAGGEIRLQDASPSLAKGVAAIAADIKGDAAGGKAKRPTSTSTSTSARPAAGSAKGKASFTVGSSASSSSNGDASEFPPLGAPAPPSASSHPRPLAERKAQNTRRRTAVDDMIDPDNEELRAKTFKRTMRIVKPGQATPTILDGGGDDGDSESGAGRGDALFGREDDAAERAERESAWQTVAVPKKPASSTIRISGSSTPTASSPASANRNIPGLTEVSKKQRQNAARAAAEKASKEAAEQERLARLAAHKRALENERSKAQQKERDKAKAREAAKTKRETLSGGMTAKVSETGALIWE